jgi:autotransporter-associated beta strand protein
MCDPSARRKIPKHVGISGLGLLLGSPLFLSNRAFAQLPAYGETGAHDPSTLQQYPTQYGTEYIYFCTGQGILSRYSYNMENWEDGPAVFSTQPAWTSIAVPGFTGDFWAPEVSYFDGIYHLYYAVSTFGSQVSAIGMATNTTLNPLDYADYKWVDQGEVIGSNSSTSYNAIDPSILVDPSGSVWMSYGSYFGGVFETQINPTTGKLLNNSHTLIASSATEPGESSAIEASYLFHQGNYYYLFVNYGTCCDGVNSTYNIRMGRSTSVNGPYVDENGVAMTDGGGTLLLGTEGNYIGPGQIGIMPEGNVDWMSYHYYDGANNGTPTYALRQLDWTNQGWPTVTAPALETVNWNNANGLGDGASWDVSGNMNWRDSVGNATYVDGDSVNFSDSNNGHYAVTLNTSINPGGITFSNSAGNYTISGTGTIAGSGSLSKAGSGAVTLSTIDTYTGGTTVIAGKLIIGAAGALPNGTVAITGGTLQLGSGTGLAQLTSLTIGRNGVFDVGNNHFILTYGSIDPINTIAGYIKSGFNNGGWNGSGIISSAAVTPTNGLYYGLGFADGADNIVAGLTSGQIEVKYTLLGDANLDGTVNGSDFSILAANFGQGYTNWDQGNFLFTPTINGTDFSALAANFGQGDSGADTSVSAANLAALDSFAVANGLPIPTFAAVPEPGSLGLFGLGTIGVLSRRRRTQ